MSVEPIGIVAALQAKRAAVVGSLSPTAKHANFPRLFARPEPVGSTTERELKRKVATLEAANKVLTRRNDDLQRTVTDLRAQLDIVLKRPTVLPGQRHTAKDVIDVYLAALNALRATEGSDPYTIDDLGSARRSRVFAGPRHVCIWLIRTLCTHYSLPMIGKLVGRRDHTSILHACQRAPQWLSIDPMLQAAACVVLARFEEKGDRT